MSPKNLVRQNTSAGRRHFLRSASILGVGSALGAPLASFAAGKSSLGFDNGERELVAFPQKRPLIVLTTRPPQLETPFEVFNQGVITPNDAFFVRYHLSGIPTAVDAATFRIKVGGKVNTPLSLSLEELKKIGDPVEFLAVNQCSGNSRGLFSPRANGGQLANGAMGNAKWTGIPLKWVLEKAGIQAGAVQVTFDGLDKGVYDATPDFVKALNIDHALDGEVMIAYAMNGEDLPMLNGYPVRLIVPGYYGTYWVKHLSDINVIDNVFNGFWMNPAYRIPDNACACVDPGTAPAKTIPINRFNVRSFITSLKNGASVSRDRETLVRGIAFDGGYGIKEVMFSADSGRNWRSAALGKDMGKYSFREWKIAFKPQAKGTHELMVRAVNRIGQSQPTDPLWNPAGYMRNVVESVNVVAA